MRVCLACLAFFGAAFCNGTLPSTAGAQAGGPDGTGSCTGFVPPPVSDFGEHGPFPVRVIQRTGPDGRFTLFLPETLGEGGFLHPMATWGNGTSSVPGSYGGLLSTVASHGFVVIASDSPRVTPILMRRGLHWLMEENESAGELGGHIATECAVALGHSRGGGAALGASSHPSVIATVSLHGSDGSIPSVRRGALLLLTATDDGVVTRERVTRPLYDQSDVVPTVLATRDVPFEPNYQGHMVPMGNGGVTLAPTIAWLRFLVYGDPSGRDYFFGPDCVLCRAPWTDLQRKNGDWD